MPCDVDSLYVQSNQTYVLLPVATCEAIGLSQTEPVTLIDFFAAYGNFTGLDLPSDSSTLFNAAALNVSKRF